MNVNIVTQARELAQTLFSGKVRRESGASVFEAHLAPVARLVEECGGDSIAIAAAYLHDVPEDIGAWTIPQIEAISPEVAQVVLACTETGEKEDWRGRKESYLAHVSIMDSHSLLVSVCDKTVSMEDFVEEWKQGNFGMRPQEVLWFFEELHRAYEKRHYQVVHLSERVSKRMDGLLHEFAEDTRFLKSLLIEKGGNTTL